jgi:tetratricopeptide (TPR) repeat protein
MVERHPSVFAAFAAALLAAAPAEARPPPPSAPPAITESRPGADAAAYAEERMRAGDCAAALDAFDQALQRSDSPELRRDRGSCHEKLGHPFPAIDDYRAYLEARPDAADAGLVREHLEALAKENGVVKPARPSSANGEATASVSVGGKRGKRDADSNANGGGPSLDTIERNEELDLEADTSPVRRGRGFALAVHFDATHFGTSGFGWAEGAGLDLRYSVSAVSALVLGFQYMDVNASGTSSSLSGPGFIAGYEARIALDKRVSDAILLGATFGYESLSQSATGYVFGVIEPKARVGYRHVFGSTFGLEASFDCGPAWVHFNDAPAGFSTTASTSLFGGHVGLVLGF